MKRIIQYVLAGSLFLLATGFNLFAQDISDDRIALSFSDPARPGKVEVGLMHGGITIEGYNGKAVIVEANVRTKKYSEKRSRPKKAEGMRLLQNASTGLSIEEDDNVMSIGAHSHNRTIDLNIKVPTRTSLNLSCINNGDISVDQVKGEFEVSNINGAVRLTNISGAVVAHAMNHDIVVSFVKVDPDKSMSFSSMNGDIDVTFPANIKATLKLKADNGDIYSDFDIDLRPVTRRYDKDTGRRRKRNKVKIESAMYGDINGGGEEIQFSNFNGNIYIRKGK